MRYPKIRELREAIKALIRGPYTSKFPASPHEPFERFRGRPQYHADDCMGCSACFQVCPAKAISMDETKTKRTLTVHWDLCVFCGQCQANCPTSKGIMLSRDFDLSTTGKRQELTQSVEKDFLLCDCCGEPIAPYEQVLWVAKKLGPLIFTNASVMLFYLQNLDLAAGESTKKEGELQRADRIKLLCPKCRRQAVLKS